MINAAVIIRPFDHSLSCTVRVLKLWRDLGS